MKRSARRALGVVVIAGVLATVVWQVSLWGWVVAPLQSPIQSPIQPTQTPFATTPAPPPPSPTPPPSSSPTPSPTAFQTPTNTPPPFGATFTPTPVGPDTRATSEAVVATITALAATPTFPPTPTPRLGALRIGSGGTASPSPTPPRDAVVFTLLSQRAYPGGSVSVAVRTRPGALCTLQAQDNQTMRALEIPGATRRAGSDGSAAWIWLLPADQPAGLLVVRVVCESVGEASATVLVSP